MNDRPNRNHKLVCCPLALRTRRAFSFCLFLISFATLRAQPLTVGDPAFVGVYPLSIIGPACGSLSAIGNGAPTNQSGYAAYTWYVACGTYGTNASIPTWTNLTSVNSGLDLTNTLALAPNPGATVNGYSTLAFTNGVSQYLRNAGYSVAAGVQFEVFMVASVTNANGNGSMTLFGDNDGSGVGQNGIGAGGGTVWDGSHTFIMNTGNAGTIGIAQVCDYAGLTNQWALYDFVFNGNSSTIYTNGVQGTTPGTSGSNQGFTGGIEIPTPYNSGAHMLLAEFLTYKTNLTSLVRSNVTYYLTNKYNL